MLFSAVPGDAVRAPRMVRCGSTRVSTAQPGMRMRHHVFKAATTETLARRRRALSSYVVDPRVPARPEEDTIMQSTYGSNPVRFAL